MPSTALIVRSWSMTLIRNFHPGASFSLLPEILERIISLARVHNEGRSLHDPRIALRIFQDEDGFALVEAHGRFARDRGRLISGGSLFVDVHVFWQVYLAEPAGLQAIKIPFRPADRSSHSSKTADHS